MKTKGKGVAIFLVAAFGFLLFFNSFFNGFVWDDEEQIVGNAVIHSLSNLPKFFLGGNFNSGGSGLLLGQYYKPLMSTTFSFLYTVFGPTPFFFHFFQVGLYVLSAILLYLVIDKLLHKNNLAIFLALLFLAHPLTSEVPFYAANLQDVLFFLFGIYYFYLFVSEAKGRLNTILGYTLPLLALLSKETALLFGIVTILYAILFKKNWFTPLLNWGAAIGVYLVLRLGVAHIGFGIKNINPVFLLSFGERLLTIPKVLTFALLGLVLPLPQFTAINQHWVVTQPTLVGFFLPLIFGILISCVLLWIGLRQKNKLYWFFLLWFVMGLGMHAQLVPLDVTFTGRWYLFSLTGLLGMVGLLVKKISWPFYLMLAVFVVLTFIRSFNFRNGFVLYQHDLRYDPGNYNLENNLGVELFRRNEFEAASSHFQKSIAANPVWWTADNNLGAYYEMRNDLPKAENYYYQSLKKGHYYLAVENYARVLVKEGKNKEAKQFLQEYLRYFPQNATLQELWWYLQAQP